VADWLTPAALADLVGASATSARVVDAAASANASVSYLLDLDPITDPPSTGVEPALVTAAAVLGVDLYRRPLAPGGLLALDDLYARLPANLYRSVAALVDQHKTRWPVG
jgi:hypothetical protein